MGGDPRGAEDVDARPSEEADQHLGCAGVEPLQVFDDEHGPGAVERGEDQVGEVVEQLVARGGGHLRGVGAAHEARARVREPLRSERAGGALGQYLAQLLDDGGDHVHRPERVFERRRPDDPQVLGVEPSFDQLGQRALADSGIAEDEDRSGGESGDDAIDPGVARQQRRVGGVAVDGRQDAHLVAQDLRLERLHVGADDGADLGQRVAVGGEGARAVELASTDRVELGEPDREVAAGGVVGEHRLEQRQRRAAGAAGDLGVGELHHDLVAQGLQTPRGAADEVVVDIGERQRSAPLREREGELAGGLGGWQLAGLGDELLEPGGVEQVERTLQPVAAVVVLDRETAVERLADRVHLLFQAVPGAFVVAAPE